MIDTTHPILYVVDSDPTSQEAIEMLKNAGLQIDVRLAPSHYRAAYATPVLFGLYNRFEGIEGIRIFVENALPLHLKNRNGSIL
jgi:hypothetical protein